MAVRGPQLGHIGVSTLAEANAPLNRMRQAPMRVQDGFMRLSEAVWSFQEMAERETTIRGLSATRVRVLRGK